MPTKKQRAELSRAAILTAARRQFARQGLDRTTIRSVASEAGIDPSMVMRYYGNKADLFRAATDIDLALPDLAAVPPARRGELAVRHFLSLWENAETEDPLRMLLASAVDSPEAAARVQEVIENGLARVVAATVDEDPAASRARAALVAAQILGLALCRYVLRLPAAVEMSPETVVAGMGPAVTAVLDQPLPTSTGR
ncbi:TetR family transcriptional regulator [Pseudonocardia sp. WMMC193]|uniref:TetR/AcrR family transcriptional regulator n=1 Tax=Pseudonocardia sp. WMMC193 TaxID=2911965 RepID=UPI001EFF7FBF|nr:TetR family transcriptional regulator [Pseudonocardia sp. WMMC193]MCF7549326.1 TetR family transcriptional regulator [Pseudonocardia sp. WMMC193]